MIKNQPVPWLRIGAESVAIVGSILLAFAIDAWWDTRVERAEEQAHIEALKDQFERTLVLQREQIVDLEEAKEATRLLLGIDGAEVQANGWESVRGLLMQSTWPGRLNFPSGALEALIAAGELRVITDRELAARLAAWSSPIAEVYENETFLLENRDQLLPFLWEHGVTLRQLDARWSDYPPSRLEPSVDTLFADARMEGLLILRAAHIYNSLNRHGDLATEATAILALIERNLSN